MRKKRINRIRIPLEHLGENERERLKKITGKFLVVIDKDPCLTCGHKVRIQSLERTDGKRELVRVCLYCSTKFHTFSNRRGP